MIKVDIRDNRVKVVIENQEFYGPTFTLASPSKAYCGAIVEIPQATYLRWLEASEEWERVVKEMQEAQEEYYEDLKSKERSA